MVEPISRKPNNRQSIPDRAKNNVQVYKLITKNSIEEKIYELQMKKAELSENMLSTQTKFINKLSKDEIMKLFS